MLVMLVMLVMLDGLEAVAQLQQVQAKPAASLGLGRGRRDVRRAFTQL